MGLVFWRWEDMGFGTWEEGGCRFGYLGAGGFGGRGRRRAGVGCQSGSGRRPGISPLSGTRIFNLEPEARHQCSSNRGQEAETRRPPAQHRDHPRINLASTPGSFQDQHRDQPGINTGINPGSIQDQHWDQSGILAGISANNLGAGGAGAGRAPVSGVEPRKRAGLGRSRRALSRAPGRLSPRLLSSRLDSLWR
ncbi:hypothetical protein chiPu_0010134 [Chiloscyllium punctatum]|uniref:Uncharacterized protein n=1 Tax=Chiloscyllium punctatum TaxID=137246 RepID=A0A401SMN2_CHIPU|nr:hypothetical protein [Chiloscyllium punctatum]